MNSRTKKLLSMIPKNEDRRVLRSGQSNFVKISTKSKKNVKTRINPKYEESVVIKMNTSLNEQEQFKIDKFIFNTTIASDVPILTAECNAIQNYDSNLNNDNVNMNVANLNLNQRALTTQVNTDQNYDTNLNNINVNMNVAHFNLNQEVLTSEVNYDTNLNNDIVNVNVANLNLNQRALTTQVNTDQNYDTNLNNDNVNRNVAYLNLNQGALTTQVNTDQNYDTNLNNDNVNRNVAYLNLNQGALTTQVNTDQNYDTNLNNDNVNMNVAKLNFNQRVFTAEDNGVQNYNSNLSNDENTLVNVIADNLNSNHQEDFDSIKVKKQRYLGLRHKKCIELEPLISIDKENLESSFSECDSGEEYFPPDNLQNIDLDDETSIVSDIDLNLINDDSKSSTSPDINDKETQSILRKEITDKSKSSKKGYNFFAAVETSKKKPIDNKRCWDKTSCCIFCEQNVTNFTRHISRKHSSEIEVARYNSLPKGSEERKVLADELRKRGNFLSNVDSNQLLKPVRRPNLYSKIASTASDFLPCKHCYGLFKKSYLYRHEKICKSKKISPVGRNKAQSDAQNLLLVFEDTDSKLVEQVFPRMAADEISKIAKTDNLIKAFGARYLRCHREKHLINVVSQKMRILARLLMQIKIEQPSIVSLRDCLNPKYFDLIVKCTKYIAGYDSSTDKFRSPSIILKIGNSLKQCCDIAECEILKNSENLKLNESQSLIRDSIINIRLIFEKQWSYDISTNACKDLYQSKWNKPAYLPLTSDIKMFRDHLINVQVHCISELTKDPNDLKIFRDLQESILAQLILLNRRRSGEVQRILLETYNFAPSEINQEEVESSLSEMELNLTKKFKRIVIRGKRGRGVPILFTPSLQKAIQFSLKIRNVTNFIDKENIYLFALPFTRNCIRGSDVLRRFSKECGAQNPSNLTSTKLRKQVATIAQILNLSEGDIEQLSTFLGHSKEVHKSFYRLSESAFQTAKVSKLLLMLENGRGNEFRGKSLDEININVDSLVSDIEENDDNDEDSDVDTPVNKDNKTCNVEYVDKKQPSLNKVFKNKKKISDSPTATKTKPKFTRVPWTEEQKKITTNYFQKHILLNRAPIKKECEDLKKKYPLLLKDKPWRKIKTFIHNASKNLNNK